jgi:hypothetical protein
MGYAENLANPSLIPELAKTEDLHILQGPLWGERFQARTFERGQIIGWEGRSHQVGKS